MSQHAMSGTHRDWGQQLRRVKNQQQPEEIEAPLAYLCSPNRNHGQSV